MADRPWTRTISWPELGGSIVDVAGRSDWQSSLYVALAPLALLRAGSRRTRHRPLGIRRLRLPDLVAADASPRPLLAADPAGPGRAGRTRGGLGPHRWWTILLSVLVAVSLVMNLTYESSGLAGITEWTRDLTTMRREIPTALNRPLIAMDTNLPRDARILLVGPAAVFHLEHPVIYNTVFNRETIEELSRDKDPAAFRRAPARPGVDPRLRRLARHRPLPATGQLWLHRLRDARAVRGMGRGRGPGPAGLPGRRPGALPHPLSITEEEVRWAT